MQLQYWLLMEHGVETLERFVQLPKYSAAIASGLVSPQALMYQARKQHQLWLRNIPPIERVRA
jgi:hypothetical protein